ncbi:MAG TPA: hypothetical protein VG455_03650 [Acidimicrobiales bacterium]|nr:hypothetical protein [Acidimicrobiales bacterium]
MGFLNWRIWDRLDALDRRFGIKPFSYQSGSPVLGIVVMAFMAAQAVKHFITGPRAMAPVELGLAVVVGVVVFRRVRASRQDRRDGDLRR